MKVGTRAKQLIQEKGLKIGWLAQQCGVGRSYMGQVLSGQRTPSPTLIRLMAVKLNVDEAELLRDSAPEPVPVAKTGSD